DPRAACRDQRCVELSAWPETPDVQVNKRYQDECKAGGGEARRPIMHAKLFERKHGAPVIERRLLQPWFAVKNRCDVIVPAQHLARNLGVAWLISANQTQTVAAEDRHQS